MLFDLSNHLIEISPDLLRLLIIPAFVFGGWLDYKSRRVYNEFWIPLIGLSFIVLFWDMVLLILESYSAGTAIYTSADLSKFFLSLSLSIIIIPSLVYSLWEYGLLGDGADIKAFAFLAVFFPQQPQYTLLGHQLPIVDSITPIFTLTILANSFILMSFPVLGLVAWNILHGRTESWIYHGIHTKVTNLNNIDGYLFEQGSSLYVDLDILRLYLRWRGISIPELIEEPAKFKTQCPDPPSKPNGASIDQTHPRPRRKDTGEGHSLIQDFDIQMSMDDYDDIEEDWCAEQFVNMLEEDFSHLSTTPEEVRRMLNHVAANENVTVSLTIPFFVLIALGLVVAITYGSLAQAIVPFV